MPKLQGLPPIRANRCCGNCGCYYTVANTEVAGAPAQGFCLKDPPNYGKVRVMVPRVNIKTGQPDIDPKTKQVIQVPTEQGAYSFRPTLPELYCMDGWRPTTAKPGQNARDVGLLAVTRLVAKLAPSDADQVTLAMIRDVIDVLDQDPPPAMTDPPAANDDDDAAAQSPQRPN